SVDALVAALAARDVRPILVSASPAPPPLGVRVGAPRSIRDAATESGRPIVLVLGDGADGLPGLDALLPSLRVASAANVLGLEAAAAILLDRVAGEG
ncbi:hypothetical protein L6R52_44445, partial [Myxococcota bacterium]|nr:hypothetical protein [Myxococcota bacterium]